MTPVRSVFVAHLRDDHHITSYQRSGVELRCRFPKCPFKAAFITQYCKHDAICDYGKMTVDGFQNNTSPECSFSDQNIGPLPDNSVRRDRLKRAAELASLRASEIQVENAGTSDVACDKFIKAMLEIVEIYESDNPGGSARAQDAFKPILNARTRRSTMVKKGMRPKVQKRDLGNGQTGYYCSVLDQIDQLIKLSEVKSMLTNSINPRDDMMSDYHHGSFCRSHPLFSNPANLRVIFYGDEVNFCNQAGDAKTEHKLIVFQMYLANIHPEFRSKSEIFLPVAVAYSASVKEGGEPLKLLLKDFIDSMNKLSSEEGYYFPCSKVNMRGGLLAVLGDMLGLHALVGAKQCFNSKVHHICFKCDVSTVTFQTTFTLFDRDLVTKRKLSSRLTKLSKAKGKEKAAISKQYGLTRRSVLLDIKGFNLVSQVLFDPMHLLLEGICKREIKVLLQALHEASFINKEVVNERLLAFPFDYDRPKAFKDNKFDVVGKSHKMIGLSIFLPLLIADLVPNDHDAFKCLVLLSQLVQMIISPIANSEFVRVLANKIQEHHMLYKKFGALVSKHHYLIHIPRQVEMFGAPRCHWAMRLESQHARLKSKKMFNFKNVPFTVANRFADRSILIYKGLTDLSHYDKVEGLDFSGKSEGATSVRHSGVEYRVGDIVVVRFRPLTFGKIVAVLFKWGKGTHFDLSILNHTYHKSVNATSFVQSSTTVQIPIDSIACYPWPIAPIQWRNQHYLRIEGFPTSRMMKQ